MYQFSSVAQSCPTLCDPMNCSTPGLPVHHQLPEFTQTHVHWVGDAIQPFHPLHYVMRICQIPTGKKPFKRSWLFTNPTRPESGTSIYLEVTMAVYIGKHQASNLLNFIFNWRLIALQYYVGFYHVTTWISHKYTYIPCFLMGGVIYVYLWLIHVKRCLLLGRKVMTNLDSIFKSRDITLPTKVRLVKAMVFPVVMYGCESWTVKKAECRSWCFWSVVFDKTLESPLDCKEIQPVHSEGDHSWDFFGRNDAKAETPVLWSPHAKSWLIGKDSDAERDWWQEEKGTTEDEMAGWHHWLDGCECEWTLGVGDGQRGLACCNSWDHKESDTTEWLNWTELNSLSFLVWYLLQLVSWLLQNNSVLLCLL